MVIAVRPLHGAPVPARGPTPKIILLAGSKGFVPGRDFIPDHLVAYSRASQIIAIFLRKVLRSRYGRLIDRHEEPCRPILLASPSSFLSFLVARVAGGSLFRGNYRGWNNAWWNSIGQIQPSHIGKSPGRTGFHAFRFSIAEETLRSLVRVRIKGHHLPGGKPSDTSCIQYTSQGQPHGHWWEALRQWHHSDRHSHRERDGDTVGTGLEQSTHSPNFLDPAGLRKRPWSQS